MKITLEWDNHDEFKTASEIAEKIRMTIKTRDFMGHIIITNEVD